MPTITQTEIDDLRDDFGDGSEAFTDAKLQRIWDRVEDAEDALIKHEAALCLMFRQAMGDAARLHDVSAGATSNKLSQVYSHYKEQYEMYLPSLREVMGTVETMGLSVLQFPLSEQDDDDADTV